jgi:hypothetical protein
VGVRPSSSNISQDESEILDFVGTTELRQDHVVDLELEVEDHFRRTAILASAS